MTRRSVQQRTCAIAGVLLLLVLAACGGESEVADPGADIVESAGIDAGGDSDIRDADQASSSVDGATAESEVDANSDVGQDATGGSTNGLVTVGDVSYGLVTSACFAEPGNLFAQGLAQSEGEFGDAWISISAGTNEDYDDDGTPDITADVTIEHGKTDRSGDAEAGMPDLFATRNEFSTQPEGINPGTLTFEISGSTISGAGELTDANGVLIPFGETLPFTFAATCP